MWVQPQTAILLGLQKFLVDMEQALIFVTAFDFDHYFLLQSQNINEASFLVKVSTLFSPTDEHAKSSGYSFRLFHTQRWSYFE